MKIVLFLGAGASMCMGMPDTKTFKEELQNTATSDNDLLQHLLNIDKFIDIEHVLKCINDFENFRSSYVEKILCYNKSDFTFSIHNNRATQYNAFIEALPNIKNFFHKKIFEEYSKNNKNEFEENKTLFKELFETIKKHNDVIEIVTTNYDNNIEELGNHLYQKFPSDGFNPSHPGGDNYWSGEFSNDSIIKLYKLHGSLTWIKINNTFARQILPSYLPDTNLLIYPSLGSKDGIKEEPFITLYKKFETLMGKANICICIGFSFRDQEIIKTFKNFLKNPLNFLFLISPTAKKDYTARLKEKNGKQIDNYPNDLKTDMDELRNASLSPEGTVTYDKNVILIDQKFDSAILSQEGGTFPIGIDYIDMILGCISEIIYQRRGL